MRDWSRQGQKQRAPLLCSRDLPDINLALPLLLRAPEGTRGCLTLRVQPNSISISSLNICAHVWMS